MKARVLFALYVFGPTSLFFVTPLLLCRVPMVVFINGDRLTEVAARFVWIAVAVCVAWFTVAIGIVAWPSRDNQSAAPRGWTPRTLWWVFVLFSTLGSAVAVIHSIRVLPGGIEEIVHLGSLAPPIGFVLGVRLVRGGIAPRRALIVWTLVALDAAVSFLMPVLLARVSPAAFGAVAILYGLAAGGVSWRRQAAAVLVLLPFIFIAFPLKEYLRTRLYNREAFGRGAPAVDRSATSSTPFVPLTFAQRLTNFDPWAQGMRFHRAEGRFVLAQFALTRVAQRINRLADLAYVIEATPATVPYARGITYTPLLSKLVPRFIWPNKPRETAGQFYGHRYPFLDPLDTVHSVNLPIPTEGWMNAGWSGVLLSAAVLGLVLRAIWTYFIGPAGAPGNVMVGMAVVGSAADGESNLSLVLGGTLHALLVYGALAAAIAWWGRTSVRRGPGRGTP